MMVTCAYCGVAVVIGGGPAPTVGKRACADAVCRRARKADRERDGGYTTKSRAKLGRPTSTVAADERRRMKVPHPDTAPERALRSLVLERDGWRCGICGEDIDRELRYPDKRAASTDHVVPIARGGAHEAANMQAAHLGCNLRKGVK